MIKMKRRGAALLALTMMMSAAFSGCSGQSDNAYSDATQILLSDDGITVDGDAVIELGSDDADITDAAVYTSFDIVYYEDCDTYPSGNAYGEGTDADKHSAEEAAAHTVVNIVKPGTYRISGTLSKGQVAVDLGDDAKRDPEAVVTLVLDGADITCEVAPAVIFYDVYECNEAWVAYDEGETEDYEAVSTVDTAAAGANVIIADGSVNNIDGAYVARIYKDNGEEKKLHKYDAAFYSKMTMNVNGGEKGDGVLNINASNEGLDTEMHLTINGGKINIASGNDGINTNEDNVSVTTINGGSLHIVAGLGDEGDGIDSNGYLVINGGTVIAAAKPQSDSGLDADLGSYVNGGTVMATGSTMDWAESDSEQVTMNLQFAAAQNNDEAIVITTEDGVIVFAYDPDQDETTGSHNRGYQGAIISSPNFEVGKTYYVYVGGDVRGSDVDGLFDPDTVTGFDGGIKQEFTGTDVGMRGFGGMGGFGGDRGNRPEGGQRPDWMTSGGAISGGAMTPPEGFEPGQRPEDGERPERPEGFDPSQLPEGFDPEQMGDRGQRPDWMTSAGAISGGAIRPFEGDLAGEGSEGNAPVIASTKFYLTDKVNAFSGVCDEGTNAPDKAEAPTEK